MSDPGPALAPAPAAPPAGGGPWLWPALRLGLVIGSAFVAWVVADYWDRWTGAARFMRTDDAYMAGDLTPLAAKVSGYVARVAVTDYQTVRQGDLLVEIEPSDYRAQLAQAEANVLAAQASLANIANQRAVQQALVRQAQATIQATSADLQRYTLEAQRQRELVRDRLAGTPQLVEQADANQKRTEAQLALNGAQLEQQEALLAAIGIQERQLQAQVRAAEAQLELARNNLGYTRILAPADGMAGQRLVRPGQFVNVGTQVIAVMPLPNIWVVANLKETQVTNLRAGQPARVTVDAFPGLVLTGKVDSWSPGTGSTFALLPPDNATGNFTKVVQRIPVRIAITRACGPARPLRPGMSVTASVKTG